MTFFRSSRKAPHEADAGLVIGRGRRQAGEAWALLRMVRETAPARFMLTAGSMLVASLLEGASLILLVPILHLLSRGGGVLTVPLPRTDGETISIGLMPVLAGFVALIALRAVMMRTRDVLIADLMFRFINRLRLETFAVIARARWEFILGKRLSNLHHTLTSDMDRVQIAASQLLTLIQSIVLLAGYLAVSLLLSKLVTLIAAIVGAAALFVLAPMRRRAARHGRDLSDNRQEQHGTIDELLNGLRIARSLNAEPRYIARLGSLLDQERVSALSFLQAHTAGTATFQILSALAAAGYIYLAIAVLDVPFANVLALVALFVRVVPPIVGLQINLQGVLTNLHAFTMVRQIRDDGETARESEGGGGLVPPGMSDVVAIRDVSFGYPGQAPDQILDRINLTIRPFRITTIVGPSGSGKSTIADLLLRLIDPREGRIEVGGTLLSDFDRTAWRARVAYVQQETFLVYATLRENMRLAREDATDNEIWQALNDANAGDFVRRLPDGLDTAVGERGTRFSGGERQRLALARALLRRPYLLILDEATSSLDWDSRRQVIETISALRGRATIVAIDHGYEMAAIADDLVVLSARRVEEAGPAQQLLDTNAYLREMRAIDPVDR